MLVIAFLWSTDSPTSDYITPLKKRRLARESMSSELSSTPPSTPVHSASMEEEKMIEEVGVRGVRQLRDVEHKGRPKKYRNIP